MQNHRRQAEKKESNLISPLVAQDEAPVTGGPTTSPRPRVGVSVTRRAVACSS